jgi:hypothetical protein
MEAVVKLFFLMVILFSDGEMQKHLVFFGDDLTECRAAKERLLAEGKARDADVWADCFEVKHQPKKAAPPAPEKGSNS